MVPCPPPILLPNVRARPSDPGMAWAAGLSTMKPVEPGYRAGIGDPAWKDGRAGGMSRAYGSTAGRAIRKGLHALFRLRWPRRLDTCPTRVAALVAYLIATLGVPLPAPALAGKDRSVPFLCMDRACGCCSADACRTRCCCFTPEQHREWEKRHAAVHRPADDAPRVHAVVSSVDENNRQPKAPAMTESLSLTTAAAACCKTPAPKASITMYLMSRCRGVEHGVLMLRLPQAAPPPTPSVPVASVVSWPPSGDLRAVAARLAPPDRPPRSV